MAHDPRCAQLGGRTITGSVKAIMTVGLRRTWVRLLRLTPTLLLDALIIFASWGAALTLRFDGEVPPVSIRFFLQVAPLIIATYLFFNQVFGVYRTAWQYGGILDVLNLARAVFVASLILFGINSLLPVRPIPRTVNVTAPAFLFLGMTLAKMMPRLRLRSALVPWDGRSKRVLIVGGGNTGQLLAREFLQHPEWRYRPICFVDDDPEKQGMRIHGLDVLGDRHDIPWLVERYDIDLVALALPSASGETVREIVDICQEAGVAIRMVPGLPEMIRGEAGPAVLREVTVEDLLGREQVEIDFAQCAKAITGKTVLITGAAGYIGSELARQLATFSPAVLHLVDINESGLYDLQVELRQANLCEVRAWVADVTNPGKMAQVFQSARPHLVIHAAAYKHVAMMELAPDVAFHTNVLGTLNVCRSAAAVGAEKLIFISSHRSAEPENVYGATKRIGELIIAAMAQQGRTIFACVRFGNVLGSRGSVVPTFLAQIDRGGPVTVVDPDSSRFFMSLTEAVRLIIQATAFAEQGQTFLLDMGKEVRIQDLAERMIRLKGLEPGKDIKIVYTGLRPGDVIHERLVGTGERLEPTHHPKVKLLQPATSYRGDDLLVKIADLEAALPMEPASLAARLHALARIDRRDVPEHVRG